MSKYLKDIGIKSRIAFKNLSEISYVKRNKILVTFSKELLKNKKKIIKEYEKDIKQQLKILKGKGGRQAKGTRNKLKRELEGLDELTSTQLRTKTKYVVEDDLKLFRKDASSHEDIQKFLENVESKDAIVTDNSASTTIINNSQSF